MTLIPPPRRGPWRHVALFAGIAVAVVAGALVVSGLASHARNAHALPAVAAPAAHAAPFTRTCWNGADSIVVRITEHDKALPPCALAINLVAGGYTLTPIAAPAPQLVTLPARFVTAIEECSWSGGTTVYTAYALVPAGTDVPVNGAGAMAICNAEGGS